jgi:hypothetical protein
MNRAGKMCVAMFLMGQFALTVALFASTIPSNIKVLEDGYVANRCIAAVSSASQSGGKKAAHGESRSGPAKGRKRAGLHKSATLVGQKPSPKPPGSAASEPH